MALKRLSLKQKETFAQDGYVHTLPPVFSSSEMDGLNSGLDNLLALLRPGETSKEIREWHETSLFLYDICMNGVILDYVEDLLGPNFFLWGSNFFIKEPHSLSTVGWHQDAYYWPLHPHESLTVWLAFDDSTKENGAMTVIPGSHRGGLLKHVRPDSTNSVLQLECEPGQFSEAGALQATLRAGQVSIHDDKLVHGSPGNPSPMRRAGLTIRYSKTNVKCDLAINPHFKTYLCRGIDEYRHNPRGMVPVQMYGRLDRTHLSVEEAGVEAEKQLGLVR